MTEKRILIILSLAEMLAMTLWFSTNAILPQLEMQWNLNKTNIALLSIAIQLGFVTGAIASSLFNISDIFKTKNVFIFSAFTGSLLTLLIVLFVNSYTPALILRFLTGMILAGIYPTAMKIMATWFKEKRGFAVSVLVGSIIMGSGMPYLFNLIGVPDWRLLLLISAILSFISALLVYFYVNEGPYSAGTAKLELKKIRHMIKHRPLNLANFGYFGHMWELYAMWVWIPVFLREIYLLHFPNTDASLFSSAGTFFIFLSGSIATLYGGKMADTIGRTKFSIIMLIISGSSSLVIGAACSVHPYAVLAVAVIWGLTIVPDSPQYSVMITELAEPKYIGTALSLQTGIGFLITIISIRLIPVIENMTGWNFVFMILAPGPVFGIWSLFRLRKEKESVKIAGGLR